MNKFFFFFLVEQIDILVNTNKLLKAMHTHAEGERKLFHGFQPDRLGLGQALDKLSGTSNQISFEEHHVFSLAAFLCFTISLESKNITFKSI